ncbi:hypothetical protein VRK_05130 [Vibrio sp. MEBiC08052]|nr:hypothetical protein VRK_05130 [Vibrio sp. MEBiC08052]
MQPFHKNKAHLKNLTTVVQGKIICFERRKPLGLAEED